MLCVVVHIQLLSPLCLEAAEVILDLWPPAGQDNSAAAAALGRRGTPTADAAARQLQELSEGQAPLHALSTRLRRPTLDAGAADVMLAGRVPPSLSRAQSARKAVQKALSAGKAAPALNSAMSAGKTKPPASLSASEAVPATLYTSKPSPAAPGSLSASQPGPVISKPTAAGRMSACRSATVIESSLQSRQPGVKLVAPGQADTAAQPGTGSAVGARSAMPASQRPSALSSQASGTKQPAPAAEDISTPEQAECTAAQDHDPAKPQESNAAAPQRVSRRKGRRCATDELAATHAGPYRHHMSPAGGSSNMQPAPARSYHPKLTYSKAEMLAIPAPDQQLDTELPAAIRFVVGAQMT